jgi:hypothetical protein
MEKKWFYFLTATILMGLFAACNKDKGGYYSSLILGKSIAF